MSPTADDIRQLKLADEEAAGSYQPIDDQLTALAALDYTGNASKVVRVNATADGFELASDSVVDGDRGDVVISGTGAIWTVEAATPADGVFDVTGSINATGDASILGTTASDTQMKVLVRGTARGIRFGTTASAGFIEGVDQTGGASYQSLVLGGSNVVLHASGATIVTVSAAGAAVVGDVTVTDEAYGVGWDGSLEVPTKNAVYDKIETVVGGGGGPPADADYGDITISGGVWTIDPGVVTLAKQANMATASLVYRKTAGAGAPEVNTLATLKTDLGLTGTNSGDQSSIVGITGSLAEFNTALTGADFATGGGTATGSNTGDQTITLTGNVTGSGTGSFATTIAASAVTLAMQANMATASVVYRKTAGAGAPEVQTLATLKTDLGLTGTNSGDQFTNMTSSRLLGRVTAGFGAAEELTVAQVKTLLAYTPGDIGAQTLDTQLTDLAGLSYVGNAAKMVKVNATETGWELGVAAGAPPAFTTTEVDLGSVPRRTGKFTIAGAGMTIGKPVMIQQAVAPYTGKGTLADEAEMDLMQVTASVTSATVITAYYNSQYAVARNFKFDYLIGA